MHALLRAHTSQEEQEALLALLEGVLADGDSVVDGADPGQPRGLRTLGGRDGDKAEVRGEPAVVLAQLPGHRAVGGGHGRDGPAGGQEGAGEHVGVHDVHVQPVERPETHGGVEHLREGFA